MTRRDRTGEVLEDDPDDVHDCAGGWLDKDTARPCLICRPWLTSTVRHGPATSPRRATSPRGPS